MPFLPDRTKTMKFNDTAALLPKPDGPPPWLAKPAEDVTLEATVLKRPVEGKANILTLLKQAMPLYDFQDFTYRGDFGADFFMESYCAEIRGVPIECSVLVHMNAQGEARLDPDQPPPARCRPAVFPPDVGTGRRRLSRPLSDRTAGRRPGAGDRSGRLSGNPTHQQNRLALADGPMAADRAQ